MMRIVLSVLIFFVIGAILAAFVSAFLNFSPFELKKTNEVLIVTPTPSEVPEVEIEEPPVVIPNQVHHTVPFTAQAPFGEWSDPRQQDACEEATTLMAVKWARSETIASRELAKGELLKIADFQTKSYGDNRDTSAQDTLSRIFKDYYQFNNVKLVPSITSEQEIIRELAKGNLVITPMNGQALNNPGFTAPGPERHMVLVIGYDNTTEEFITNDPGIRAGQDYRYPYTTFFRAIRDYETGYHLPITSTEKPMIVISKD